MTDKVTCPFNPVHVVERHRLVVHMGRCIQSYKGGSHTPMHCPLDYSHVIEAGKMNDHLMSCSQLALAAPLISADFSQRSDIVTGNLQLPEPPSCINDLVTAEWDTPEPEQQQQQDFFISGSSAAAAAAPYSAASANAFEYADGDDAMSDVASSYLPSGPRGVGLGRGRGFGRGRGSSGHVAELADVGLATAEYQPGDLVPGGYELKRINYPPGFGPRGRFEIRGSI